MLTAGHLGVGSGVISNHALRVSAPRVDTGINRVLSEKCVTVIPFNVPPAFICGRPSSMDARMPEFWFDDSEAAVKTDSWTPNYDVTSHPHDTSID